MDGIFVKKTRDGRRKRLEIQRLRSNGSNDSLSSYGVNGTTTTTASAAAATTDYAFFKKTKKTGLRNKVVPSCDLNVNDLNKKLSSSEEEEESTVEIPVSGGVNDGVEICAGEELQRLRCASHGCVSVCGRRREMEDAVTMVPEFLSGGFDFFGVYDGHGGARVAHECRDRLHGLLAKELESSNGGDGGGGVNDGDHKVVVVVEEDKIDWEKVMVGCFLKMDEEVSGNRGGVEVVEDMKSIGSTAVVALVGREKIIVANCGDSRAVMARGGVAVPLSRDHRPDRSDELERVEAAGGRVINWNGYRVLGVLATSRSIGDHYLKPYVISVPEVTVTQRMESDEFLVLASDGLWDVMSNEQVCDVVRRCLQGRILRRSSKSNGASRSGIPCTNAAEAAAVLTELAMARGSRDNVSVVVIELNKTKVVSS